MKYILLACALVLSGCANESPEPDEPKIIKANMPEGLKDCKIFSVKIEYGSHILVTRCPNSATTTDYDKNGKTVVAEEDINAEDQ